MTLKMESISSSVKLFIIDLYSRIYTDHAIGSKTIISQWPFYNDTCFHRRSRILLSYEPGFIFLLIHVANRALKYI